MSDEQRREDEPSEATYPDATTPEEPGAFGATRPLSQTPPPLTPPGQPGQPDRQAQPGQWGQPPQQGQGQGQQEWGRPAPQQEYPHWQQQPPGQQGQWGQGQQGQGQWGQPGAYGASGQWGQPGQGGQAGQPGQQGQWGQQPPPGQWGQPQGQWGQQPGQQGYPQGPQGGWNRPGVPGYGASAQQGQWGAPATKTRKPLTRKMLAIIGAAALLAILLIGLLIWGVAGRQEASAACDNQKCELTLVRKGATVNLKTAGGDKVITQQGIDGDTATYSIDGNEQTCRAGNSSRVSNLNVTCSTIDGDKLVLTVRN